MNKYEKIRILGEGTYGVASLFRRKRDGKYFVIKEIKISSLSQKDLDDAINEACVLSSLNHPYIIKYEESFQENTFFYIVMEYANGGDLLQKIKERKNYFSESEVLHTFIQIALAVKCVHDKKILHRDLKAQNIFLMKDGTVKLGDFGIAKILDNTFQLCKTRIGTPYYLSPEICEGKNYSSKTDIWSLGCILYELCTLKHAFNACNINALAFQIIRGKYEPIPSCFSPELKQLITRMLTNDPNVRLSINGVLNTPIIKSKLHQFLLDATPKKPIFQPSIIKSSISEASGIKLEKQNLYSNNNNKICNYKSNGIINNNIYQYKEKPRDLRQHQINEFVKRRMEEQKCMKQKQEVELFRKRKEALMKKVSKSNQEESNQLTNHPNIDQDSLRIQNYYDSHPELDTLGKIRFNEFKEAYQNAQRNKMHGNQGHIDFEGQNIADDSLLKGMMGNIPKWASPSHNDDEIQRNEIRKQVCNPENKRIGGFDKHNPPSISNPSSPQRNPSLISAQSPTSISKSRSSLEYISTSLDSSLMASLTRDQRRKMLHEQRMMMEANRQTLKSLEQQTQEFSTSKIFQPVSTIDNKSTNLSIKINNSVPEDNGKTDLSNMPISQPTVSFLTTHNAPDDPSSNISNEKAAIVTTSRLQEFGLDPSLARNEEERKILMDLDLELSQSSNIAKRSKSKGDLPTMPSKYVTEDTDTTEDESSSINPEANKTNNDECISKPLISVVEAKSHVSKIHTLVSSIKSVLNLPTDADDTNDSFEIPSASSQSHALINKEVRFPVVADNDSLMYRAEAMRAFLERELGIEKFIELRREIENENEGFHVVSNYPDVLPGLIIILQQLIVLEAIIADL